MRGTAGKNRTLHVCRLVIVEIPNRPGEVFIVWPKQAAKDVGLAHARASSASFNTPRSTSSEMSLVTKASPIPRTRIIRKAPSITFLS